MLHFGMNMPFPLMAVWGSLMIVITLLLRALLKKKLPKFVFPVLWFIVLLRLLVPFSLSSPLSVKVPDELLSYLSSDTWAEDVAIAAVTEDIAEGSNKSQDISGSAARIDDTAGNSAEAADSVLETTAVSGMQDTANAVAVTFSPYGSYNGTLGYFFRRFSLPVLYVLGLLITLGILLFQKYRYSMKLKNRLLIEHNETINGILRDIDMGHILVFSNDEIASPLVCGLLAPRIYLPTRMDFGNTELLRHIFTHETMHIRRKDNWLKTMMLAALCLHWFNPLVWLMSRLLSSDLEAACDEAVLRQYHDEEARKSYAYSLLAMAITGNRSSLLYSAFSKTEVERRVQNILHYKKTSVFLFAATAVFLTSSILLFSSGMQAPFLTHLTPFMYAPTMSRWGVQVELTRDIALGTHPEKRAVAIISDILRTDSTNDSLLLETQMRDALSKEFRVEKSAFSFQFVLVDDEELSKEYTAWELTQDKNGFFLYQNTPVRTFTDETRGYYQSKETGDVDITVHRNRYGEITNITALREGDADFDNRSMEIERNKTVLFSSGEATATTTQVEDITYFGY
ncbi:MAG: hypothetical protein NC419_10365 [Muribaculaceae bacterium]|nr:hypothetical protein [Muribaculaceae bacterium]